MSRVYLYAIVNSEDRTEFSLPGVGGANTVYTLAHQGVGGVVSDYPGADFACQPKEQVLRHLLNHQQVVEHAMQHYTVLPMKFGTLLDSPREVLDLLSQGHFMFTRALASIQDVVEIEVAATWDLQRVLQQVGQEQEVARARDTIAHRGQPTREDQLELGKLVKARLDQRRESYCQRMVEFLRPLGVDAAANALVSDEMVLNVAFLVERARQQEFDHRVQELDGLFEDEIRFRVVGPLPPYSFCRVEITELTPEAVRDAQQMLHLEDGVSEVEVKRAYRRLAAQKQARSASGGHDGPASASPSELRRASELLLRYCQAYQVAHNGAPLTQGSPPRDGALFFVAISGSKNDEVEPARFGGGVSSW